MTHRTRDGGAALGADRITQEYLRRYPTSARSRSWAGRMVHIETDRGVWRVCAEGYTYAGREDAWVLPFEQAQREVAHCGPEKRAAFVAALSKAEGRGHE